MTTIYLPKTAGKDDFNFKVLLPLRAALEASRTGVMVEIKEHKTRRSNDQNSFYFLNIKDVAGVLNDAGCTYGEHELPYTSDLVHEINKAVFGISTTTKLSTKEFCDYMTRVFEFWINKTAGTFVPKESPYSYLERTGLIEKQAA